MAKKNNKNPKQLRIEKYQEIKKLSDMALDIKIKKTLPAGKKLNTLAYEDKRYYMCLTTERGKRDKERKNARNNT